MKIAIIGAGSVGFTRKLVRTCCSSRIAGHGIRAARHQRRQPRHGRNRFWSAMSTSTGCRPRVSDLDRASARAGRRALRDLLRARRGPRGFRSDIEVPLQYGVDQCVGDTICAGGIMYGQRTIPAVLDFCNDIREVSRAGRAVPELRQPHGDEHLGGDRPRQGRDTIGLCHGVQHGWRQIAEVLGAENPHEVEYICCGINHQTWYIDIRLRGRRVGGDELLAAFERHPVYSQQEKVRIDVLRRFGCYSTESNGHLSEYLPWYRKRPEEIGRWIDMSRLDQRRNRRIPSPLHGNSGTGSRRISRCCSHGPRSAIEVAQAHRRAREPHHRGAGDRASLSRALQRQEQRRHHQSPAGRHRRVAGLRRPFRRQHGGGLDACRWPAQPPAPRRSMSSAWRSKRL